MQWWEVLIAVGAAALVVLPIVTHFVQKKKGTLKCECGHPRSQCTGNCKSCSIVDEYHKDHKREAYVYKIHVEGMKCGACETHINDTIRNKFQVKSVRSSRSSKETIVVSKAPMNVDEIKGAISALGYKVE